MNMKIKVIVIMNKENHMKTRVLALSIILLTSTKCLANGTDHLGKLTKDADALKEDISSVLKLVDETILVKLNDLDKLGKEFSDFTAAVEASLKQKRAVITEVFKSIQPLEERLLFLYHIYRLVLCLL